MVLTRQLLGSVFDGGSDALFFPLVFLHVVSAVAGFASIGFAGTYASRAVQRPFTAEARRDGVVRDDAVPGDAVPGDAVPGDAVPAVAVPGDAPSDPETEEITRYFQRPARFWKAVLAVPVFGLGALAADPGGGGLDQVWAIAALLVWVCASLIVVGIIVPALGQMSEMLLRPRQTSGSVVIEGAERARLTRAGALASRGAAVCDVLFFVALALMIWRP